ncbi:MAG: heme-binding domain-containing protein [Sulfurimonas sp.]|nr:heme-binding domain-containing protein [Sulfurimonas sp.]MDQ7068456.1 heme-binding domain-containing protein [Sulfurimonas sp.]
MKTKFLIVMVLIALAIQFVPYGKEHQNPPVLAQPEWDSPKTKEIFTRACADCHSNETKWPFYSKIAPISWLVQYDVDEGREHFNVSMWGIQKKNDGDEAKEEFEEGEMPPWFYVIAHPEAKLTPLESEIFMKGLVNTFGEEEDDD